MLRNKAGPLLRLLFYIVIYIDFFASLRVLGFIKKIALNVIQDADAMNNLQ